MRDHRDRDEKPKPTPPPDTEYKNLDYDYCPVHGTWYRKGDECPDCRAERSRR